MGKWLQYVAFAIILMVIPLFLRDDYYLHVLIMICIWSILGISLNLLLGFTGQISLAHGTFFGIGAYTSGILSLQFDLNTWISFILAGIIAAFFAFLIGIPSFRTRGLYFAIVTLGFGIIAEQIFSNWISLTNGPMGLSGIPIFDRICLPTLVDINFTSKLSYYFFAAVLLIVCLIIFDLIINSDMGRALKAIREDELLSSSVGILISRFKILAFVISAFFAGIMGSYYAHYIRFISPPTFGVLQASFKSIVICIIGGMGTVSGPILGAILLTVLPEILRVTIKLSMLIYAFSLLLCIIFMPDGIAGRLKSILKIE
jgi:branched-chain amino acid transport system permease protein